MRIISLLLLASGFFVTVLVMIGALLWLNSGLTLGVQGYLVSSLLIFIGSYTCYKIFARLRTNLSSSSFELLHSYLKKLDGSLETLRVAVALIAPFTLLWLTGLYSWVDSYLLIPKIAYPSLIVNIVFFPMILGSTLLSPIMVHFEVANAAWATSILRQIPTLFQLALIFWIAEGVVKLKGARKRGYRDPVHSISGQGAC